MKNQVSSSVAGCEQPIEMFHGSHKRIRARCLLVERIAAQLATRLPDAEIREAAHSVVCFFDTAVAAHHRDEEEDIFPALVENVRWEEIEATRSLVARLRAEHVRLEALWHDVRRSLVLLASDGNHGPTATQAAEFRQAYERHIALEEREVLPLAQRVLGPALFRRIGARMAERRAAI